MNKLKEIYKKYYYISPLELADFAETNRSRNSYWCLLTFFIYIILDFAVWIPFNFTGVDRNVFFVFLCISAADVLCSHLLSRAVKNVSREKAWPIKNIPVYAVFVWGMSGSAYIFYCLQNPFFALIHFFGAVSIMFVVFHLVPPAFLIVFFAGAGAMLPGIYRTFGYLGAASFSILSLLIAFLSLYKRYTEKQYLSLLKRQKKVFEAKTFGNFTLLHEGQAVKFSRSKTAELIAYLICKNGSSANTKELLCALYGEHADSARYGSSLRALISDAKKTFSELEIQNFFSAEYNNFRINPEAVKCDYYDFLAGDQAAKKRYAGQFMSQYSWAEETAAFLERKALAG